MYFSIYHPHPTRIINITCLCGGKFNDIISLMKFILQIKHIANHGIITAVDAFFLCMNIPSDRNTTLHCDFRISPGSQFTFNDLDIIHMEGFVFSALTDRNLTGIISLYYDSMKLCIFCVHLYFLLITLLSDFS